MANISLSSQQLLSQALAQLNSAQNNVSGGMIRAEVAAQQIATNHASLQNPLNNQIQSLIRQLIAHGDSPSEALRAIETALTDSTIVKSPVTKSFLEQTLKQLQQGTINGHDSDTQKIKQLLMSAPMHTTQLTSAASASGLLGGLARLLQLTLVSRLAKNQPTSSGGVGTSESIKLSLELSNLVASLFQSTEKTSKAQVTQSVKDLHLLEQKHQLLLQLKRLFSQHQSNKLISAEQNLQDQNTLYYVLPSAIGETRKDVQILIKKENENSAENKANESKNNVWQLTMKLQVGELGELLSKVKLNQDELKIHFYASNEQLKNRVNEYIPMLIKRLKAAGICITATHCQIGKIPETLISRSYQLFETQA